MDVLYSADALTAAELRERLPEAPGYSAVHALVETFFGGSPDPAVAALLDDSRGRLSEAELGRLAGLIATARSEGR